MCLLPAISSSTQTPLNLPSIANPTATLQILLPLSLSQLIINPTIPALPNPSPKLNWADDVTASLPVFIPPTVSVPCDLSCLHSGKTHPFGALCQCDCHTHHHPKNTEIETHLPALTPSLILFISPISSAHISRKPYISSLNVSPSHMSPSSRLDWESDPHLFALSSALKALGWNQGVS